MFKMIISAVFALGVSSVAFANDPATTHETKTETHETTKTETPAKGKKAHAGKDMAKKTTTTTTEEKKKEDAHAH